MKRTFFYHDGLLDYNLPLEKICQVMSENCGSIWLDIECPEEEDFHFLEHALGFHHLAVEDCRMQGMQPKMEDYGDFLFFVLRGINYSSGIHALDTLGIKIFFTGQLVVSVHHKSSRTIEDVIQRLENNPKILEIPETLFLHILDALTDNILPVIAHVEERLEIFQHHIFMRFSQEVLQEHFELKKWVLRLRHFMVPQEQIILRLIKEDHPMFTGKLHYYLRDVLDHTRRVMEHLEIYEQLFPDAMNTYLTQVTNRMNEVMKTMSIIATLMLPLSFITGIFGMNFIHMPLTEQGSAGFWLIIGFMTIVFLGMVVYFKRKDWF